MESDSSTSLIPAELQSTTKLYAYLNTIGQPQDPSCPCTQIHPLPHHLPTLADSCQSIACPMCTGVIPSLAISSLLVTHLQDIVQSHSKEHHSQQAKQLTENINDNLLLENSTLKEQLANANISLQRIRDDLNLMGEKLLDELEIRAEVLVTIERVMLASTFQGNTTRRSRRVVEKLV